MEPGWFDKRVMFLYDRNGYEKHSPGAQKRYKVKSGLFTLHYRGRFLRFSIIADHERRRQNNPPYCSFRIERGSTRTYNI